VWRWVGLAAAVAVYLSAVLTYGLGFALAPVSLTLSGVAIRRLPTPRGWLPWLGLTANALLLVPFIIWTLPALIWWLLTATAPIA
jgi:hypothetical protein